MKLVEILPENHRKLLSVYITFIVFMIVNWYFDRSLFTMNRISTLAVQFAPLILVAMAQTMIMLTGGIDLSSGAILSLMTAVVATTMGDSGVSVLISVILTLLCGILVGLVMGSIVTVGRLPAIIVTLAFSYIWKGVTLFILPIPGGYVSPIVTKWVNGPSALPAGVVIVGIALIIWKAFKNTKYGIYLYAVGDNDKAAFINGIPTNKIRILAYVMSGFFIAIAGITLAAQTGSGDPNIGNPYQLNAVAASVLGGVSFMGGSGQVRGTVMGAIIITSLMNILYFSGISPFYQYIVRGVILIAAIGLKTVAYRKKGGVAE